MDNPIIHVLVAVRLLWTARYRENLSKDPSLKLNIVTSEAAARDVLNDPNKQSDVLVIDNGLGNVFETIKELRQTHPRLLILLVDEEADFGMPGRADDVSTDPFHNDDLIRKIKRMTEDRRLETLRADALPPVRNFAKALRKANKGLGKQQAAVTAIKELGYDYVAFYQITPTDPPSLSIGAQVGPNPIQAMMPVRTEYSGLLGWVAQHGQSKVVNMGEEPSHLLLDKQRFGTAACVPVGSTLRFGVILACREQPGSIKADNVLMLELVSAQLASALAREQRS
jgi:hypothetical protein